jgi:hypothetical protein
VRQPHRTARRAWRVRYALRPATARALPQSPPRLPCNVPGFTWRQVEAMRRLSARVHPRPALAATPGLECLKDGWFLGWNAGSEKVMVRHRTARFRWREALCFWGCRLDWLGPRASGLGFTAVPTRLCPPMAEHFHPRIPSPESSPEPVGRQRGALANDGVPERQEIRRRHHSKPILEGIGLLRLPAAAAG